MRHWVTLIQLMILQLVEFMYSPSTQAFVVNFKNNHVVYSCTQFKVLIVIKFWCYKHWNCIVLGQRYFLKLLLLHDEFARTVHNYSKPATEVLRAKMFCMLLGTYMVLCCIVDHLLLSCFLCLCCIDTFWDMSNFFKVVSVKKQRVLKSVMFLLPSDFIPYI